MDFQCAACLWVCSAEETSSGRELFVGAYVETSLVSDSFLPLPLSLSLPFFPGNICRSPIGEAVFRKLATDEGVVSDVS